MNSPYATNKVIYNAKIMAAIKKNELYKMAPTLIHLMPENRCNQNCHYCSYRMDNWKNSICFDARSHIAWDKMRGLLHEFAGLDVKAIEITGGGEPLMYPHMLPLLSALAGSRMKVALVTNGTLLTDEIADALYETSFTWGRVSIDAGTPETYSRGRRVNEKLWYAAWEGIKRLVDRRTDQLLGVGFVVTPDNFFDIERCCEKAKWAGVDNVRVSAAFTPEGSKLFTEAQLVDIEDGLEKAKLLNCGDFHVYNLFHERLANLSKTQDYSYCPMKDLLCVVEGSGDVYTCCTLTGNPSGLVGNISERSFIELWDEKAEWRKEFDPRKSCQCECLYEKRNKGILELCQVPPHLEFI